MTVVRGRWIYHGDFSSFFCAIFAQEPDQRLVEKCHVLSLLTNYIATTFSDEQRCSPPHPSRQAQKSQGAS